MSAHTQTGTETDADDEQAEKNTSPVRMPAGRSTTANATILTIEAKRDVHWRDPDVNPHVPSYGPAGYEAAMQARRAVERERAKEQKRAEQGADDAQNDGANEDDYNPDDFEKPDTSDETSLHERDDFDPADYADDAEDGQKNADEPAEGDSPDRNPKGESTEDHGEDDAQTDEDDAPDFDRDEAVMAAAMGETDGSENDESDDDESDGVGGFTSAGEL